MTGSRSGDEGPSEAEISAAIKEASRSLGVPDEAVVEPGTGTGPSTPWPAPVWIVIGLLALGIVTALAVRGSGSRGQPAHLIEADLRWAVVQVVEHVENERLLRGRIPEERRIRVLLGEALTYSVEEDGYRVVGRRDGVRVEYDGSVPLEGWRALVLHPPGPGSR